MGQHPFPALARAAVEEYVRAGVVLPPPEPLSDEMRVRAGVFVSLHQSGGALRGCIGTVQPVEDNLAKEIIRNAVSAASRDPRFLPVQTEELDDLTYSVDVLTPPEAIETLDELEPRHYGVIVEKGWRRGLLLPDIEGVDSAELQVGIALDKAGIHPREAFQLFRFEVQRYH
jgi:AmmeMemoRadiSam system protein A